MSTYLRVPSVRLHFCLLVWRVIISPDQRPLSEVSTELFSPSCIIDSVDLNPWQQFICEECLLHLHATLVHCVCWVVHPVSSVLLRAIIAKLEFVFTVAHFFFIHFRIWYLIRTQISHLSFETFQLKLCFYFTTKKRVPEWNQTAVVLMPRRCRASSSVCRLDCFLDPVSPPFLLTP